MVDYLTTIAVELGIPVWTLIIILTWTAFWKLLALWKAAREKSIVWFILLALINTVGILEIFYIFVFSKSKTLQFKYHHHSKPVQKTAKKKVSQKKAVSKNVKKVARKKKK